MTADQAAGAPGGAPAGLALEPNDELCSRRGRGLDTSDAVMMAFTTDVLSVYTIGAAQATF